MTRAASALFTAESADELAAHLDTWASTLFPKAEWALQPLTPAPSPSSGLPDSDVKDDVRALAAETLADAEDAPSDRTVRWLTPSAPPQSSPKPAQTDGLPKEVGVIPLAQDIFPHRTALLVYPNSIPSRLERDAVGAFAKLAQDASAACSPLSPSLQDSSDPTDRLLEVANTIASQLELSDAIRVVAEQTSALLNADRSSVWLYDKSTDEIYTIVAQELDSEEIRMPADQGVAGHVLQTGIPLNLEDAYAHSAFDPNYDQETGYRTRSMLCTPLHSRQGETLGVFQVINKQGDNRFTAEDEVLLETVAGSAAVAIENALRYEEQQKQFESFIQVLATTIDSRDPTTGQHTVMVTGLAVLIAEEMDLAPDIVENIRVAGILHDVGKIVLPDEVLLKQGKLTDSEYEVAKSHATHTIRILERIHFHRTLEDVPKIAGAHHERLDGEGYPEGRSATDLTLPMRILAAADVFHALLQDRPYKDSFSIEEALAECRRISGSSPNPPDGEQAHLDPRVVKALSQHIEREGTENLRERVFDRSGFEKQNVFAPELNLPD